MLHDHKRGTIRSNALHALVTSPLFKTRAEVNKKGKGSYKRFKKNTSQEMSVSWLHKAGLPTSLETNHSEVIYESEFKKTRLR